MTSRNVRPSSSGAGQPKPKTETGTSQVEEAAEKVPPALERFKREALRAVEELRKMREQEEETRSVLQRVQEKETLAKVEEAREKAKVGSPSRG